MRGMNLAELGHIVNILPPIDISGGASGDVFSLKNHTHATIIVQVGVSAAAFTKIILNECSGFDGADATAIPFAIYKEETAGGDTLGSRVTAESSGVAPASEDKIFYVIELDAAELSEGHPFVQLVLTNGANSVIASAVAILTGSRFAGDQSPTVIA